MSSSQVFEQSIRIKASSVITEECLTDLKLMHRWLNPLLKCEPIGTWSTDVGSLSRFTIKIPLLQPSLRSRIAKREPGLVVWEFDGFFKGRDRWECHPIPEGTFLLNRFEFAIPNPVVSWGFNNFAANLTRKDMQAQLKRLKKVAEEVYRNSDN
ncbi:SRPBCC family protein [Pleurocapsales cyanobacterium LEGE 10410]|nr:SRPBCC family protein [Pleurocapsales cyanobacterium LEGE 10410]